MTAVTPSDRTAGNEQLRCGERLGVAGASTNAPTLQEKLAERTRRLREQAATAGPTGPQTTFLTFAKGRQRYGVLLDEVLEVQALDQYSAVPGAPPFVPGVVHFRGEILALLDLGRLLNIPETGLADIHFYIVVEAGGRRVAVVAGQIDDLISVASEQIAAAPLLPGQRSPDWMVGVHEENCLIVRMDRLLTDPQLL